MAYSETRIVIGGLAHVPVLICIANFIKGKFGIKTKKAIENVIKEEPIKMIEVKETVVIKEKKAINDLSSKLDNIEEKADEVYKKVMKKKKDMKKKKKKDMKRD